MAKRAPLRVAVALLSVARLGALPHELSAHVAPDGAARVFESSYCRRNFTLPSLASVFAAHAVEWNVMGKERPWWSVMSSDQYRGETLDEPTKAKFYATGAAHVGRVVADLGLEHSRVGSVLDFGCGLGRLAFHFAALADEVACADQSVFHLRLAEAEGRARFAGAAARVDFVVTTTDLLAALGGRRFDVVHSVIVLQHAVSPLQTVFLEQLCDAMKPGGRGWIQIPTMTPIRAKTCALEASVVKGGMQMHFTPRAHIERTLASRGCSVDAVTDGHSYVGRERGYESVVMLIGKKPPPPPR